MEDKIRTNIDLDGFTWEPLSSEACPECGDTLYITYAGSMRFPDQEQKLIKCFSCGYYEED